MLTRDIYDYIKGKGTAKTETQLNILLQILVRESLEKFQNNRSPRSREKWIQIQFYKDMLEQDVVTSVELEKEVNRMTLWRNERYLIENCLLESHHSQEDSKRPWRYYNTTPLGKVLAMRFWYQKREPQIKMKVGREVKIPIEPTELLSSFFKYLPRLEKYSKTIKESASRELGLNDALKYTFPEIDIKPGIKKSNTVGIEVKFRWLISKQVQITKYFSLPKNMENHQTRKEKTIVMYGFVLDSLTFIFLRNLEAMQKELGVKNPVIVKILNDPDLRSFYQQYKTERQQDLRESLNFLSDDN